MFFAVSLAFSLSCSCFFANKISSPFRPFYCHILSINLYDKIYVGVYYCMYCTIRCIVRYIQLRRSRSCGQVGKGIAFTTPFLPTTYISLQPQHNSSPRGCQLAVIISTVRRKASLVPNQSAHTMWEGGGVVATPRYFVSFTWRNFCVCACKMPHAAQG